MAEFFPDKAVAPDRISETLRQVLEQLPTLQVEDVHYEPALAGSGASTLARMTIVGHQHEVVCALNARGDLLSARVIEV